jgi:hypothetical protein
MGEVTGGWRRLHTEEHHNLYSSRNTVRLTKSRGCSCRPLRNVTFKRREVNYNQNDPTKFGVCLSYRVLS